jgi:DNA polymerase-3 subunit epsilon
MEKNIICYDVETTGLNPQEDFIIQLSMVKFDRNSFEIIDEKNWYIKPAHKYTINPQAQEKHGISKEWLDNNGIYLKDIIQEIDEFIKDCDFLTYNGNSFDIKFLYKDLKLWGYELDLNNRKFYDSFGMECRFNPRNLSFIYNKYTGKDLEGAHNALADVKATIEVFSHQKEQYKLSWDDLNDFQENNLLSPEGSIRNAAAAGEEPRIVFAIGKYKDSEFMEVYRKDPGYIKWFSENVATSYTLNILREYYKKHV